ncbi:MAG TPA: CoA-acylating methylmalonate-semialdehyde dehydrogenase [Thermoflexales bacterium]|nr:CoA-acylating methylmalonate-semialdehyde dehydrogenase [Thermoflexales bacterium]HQW34654.1 CoA-acylating methylmalonate-semialdehyde dehydrogenase [Thermoflexales bacterium]HQZ21111.1 CoA-acylating methylmalonate-semialdehyde dehydrogenase [Thermoflexales bacterium]
MPTPILANFVEGAFQKSAASETLPVKNPATGETLSQVPLSPAQEVDRAAQIAAAAQREWKRMPTNDRAQPLYKLKALLEANRDDLAATITKECGKTLAESQGEIQRGIENIEVACGAPMLMQGVNNEDIARGIDEHMIRQPLGVTAAITPFNFPAMIPLWFLPYAVACGNAFILKPSEKVPMSAEKMMALVEQAGFPKGVIQMVNGSKEVVDAILDHPTIRAISFVGSTPVAKYIYQRGAANGKRVQAQGGAKNPVVIMPDADMDTTTKIVADSAFGCAGQRCLAASVGITVGSARNEFLERLADTANSRKVGYGLLDGTEMGPVITKDSQARINKLIALGESEGAHVLVDGRQKSVSGYEDGNWVFPTILDGVNPAGELSRTEVFGPVFSLSHAQTVDEAIAMVNARAYGNMACIFTTSGATARQFRNEVTAGNVGINIGVAAPMAYFPFSGWRESFFGDLHAQGRHGVEFYTETKVVIERWPKDWSRKF